jgi:hypothetical protein
MNTVVATLQVPEHIAQGLLNAIYEREVGSKQVVAWLREAQETGQPVLSNIMSLSSVGAVSSILNLAVSQWALLSF